MNLALLFFISIFTLMRIPKTNGQRIREFVDDGGEDEQQPIQTSTRPSLPTSMPSSSMAPPRPVIRMSLDPVEFRKEHLLLPQEGLKKEDEGMNHQHDHHNHANQTAASNATFSGMSSNQTVNGTAEAEASGVVIKTAPHTLEALMEGANGTATAGGGGRHKNVTELALPIGILASNELPVPLEGFLPPAATSIRTSSASSTTKMAGNSSTTQSPTMRNATTTTTTLPPLILQPVPIQPEGPVVLPETLGNCADGHENCPFWAKNGFCQNQFYSQQMRARFCASSCGLC